MRGARLSYIVLFLTFSGLAFAVTVLSVGDGFINEKAAIHTIISLVSAIILVAGGIHSFLRIIINEQILDFKAYIAGACVVVGSVALSELSAAGSTLNVILIMATMMMLASSYPRTSAIIFIVVTGMGFAIAASGRRVTPDAVVIGSAAVAIVITRVLAENIITDWKQTTRLFNQARWAASELSGVVMRLEETVHKARIYEITKERKRVAREVHDTIGYALTGLIVQIGVAGKLVENEVARERLESLEQIARTTLQEVREEVTVLRNDIESDDITSWRERWIQVCDYFSECTGIRVDHHIDTNLAGIPKAIGETYYRIIQEGLTNAYRHGKATTIDISMTYKKTIGMILFRISDNGEGVEKLKAGNGLSGIRERIDVHNGTMVYDSRLGKGFDLGVDIPLPEIEDYGTYKSTGS